MALGAPYLVLTRTGASRAIRTLTMFLSKAECDTLLWAIAVDTRILVGSLGMYSMLLATIGFPMCL